MQVNVPAPAFPFIHIHINKRKWGRVWRTIAPLVVVGLILVAAAVAGAVGYHLGKGGDKGSGGAGAADRYANTTTVTNDTDLSDLKQLTDNANQEAYKAIAEVSAKLRSDLVKYDTAETGATGDIIATVWGPKTVYGFSAFPVQVKLEFRESPIPFNYIHIRSIKVYIKDEDGRVYWQRVWDYGAGSEGMNGGQAVYTTILKVPDDYLSLVQSIVSTGQLTKEQAETLFNATTRSWEIYVDIDAYRESWQSTNLTQDQCTGTNLKWDSNSGVCYEFVKNVDIDYSVNTLSAWRHVTRASDVVLIDSGMYASIPVKFIGTQYASKWTIYKEKFAGAVSNVFVVTAATPVHVIGSTADYRFNFAANPDYFSPLSPQITDDFRLIVVKVDSGGHYSTADSVLGNLGTLSSSIEKQLSARYTADPDATTYKVYTFAVFNIKRDDNTTIPVWLAVEPQISVLQNERLKLDDTQIEQLTQLVSDNEISEADREQIVAQANEWITGLQDKIAEAEQLKEKAEAQQNEKAKEYAEKAIAEYQAAVKDLEKMKASGDVQTMLNYLNAAKKHEIAGDYYKNAAYKALSSEFEQAELDVQKAAEYSDLAKDYEPGFSLAGLGNISLPFGLTMMDLLVISIGLVVAWLGRKAFGPIGALFGLAIVVGWFIGSLGASALLNLL